MKKESFKLEAARHRRPSFWLIRLHLIALAIGRIIPISPSPPEYPAFSKVRQLVDSSLQPSLLHR
jgi:hypothetical protein